MNKKIIKSNLKTKEQSKQIENLNRWFLSTEFQCHLIGDNHNNNRDQLVLKNLKQIISSPIIYKDNKRCFQKGYLYITI